MPNFRPLYDHCLISRKKSADKIGLIIIPDNAKEKMLEGTVLAVGQGIVNPQTGILRPADVKVGDRVLFASQYVGTDVKIEEKDLVVCRQNDLATVIAEDGTLRPMFDRLVVQRASGEKKIGSLYVPESAIQKTTEGTVLALGSGAILSSGVQMAWDFAVGDRILFGKYAGSEVKVDGKEMLILREDEVLGVVE
jgi:chaperonin GroES